MKKLFEKFDLVSFVFGGIFWSIIYIFMMAIKLTILFSQGEIITP